MVATDPRFAESGYAHPEVLVSTDWVAEHLDDPNVRIVESDEDVLLYDMGHIPGAIKLDWHTDLQDQVEARFYRQGGLRGAVAQERHRQRHDRRVLRRPQQLVRHLRLLAVQVFRPQRRAGHERRPRQVGGRGPAHVARRSLLPGDDLHRAGAGRAHPGLPRRRAEAGQVGRAGAGRCPLRARVHRRGAAHGGLRAGGRAAGRPRPGRQEHPLGDRGQRGRHLQEPGGARTRSTAARASPRTRT